MYLKGRPGDKMIHEKNIDQLKSEVQYIQEVRTLFLGGREGAPRVPEPKSGGLPFFFFCSLCVTAVPMASYVSYTLFIYFYLLFLF